MKILIILLVLIVIGFLFYNSFKSKPNIKETFIRIIIPLSDFDTFEPDIFTKEFVTNWQTQIVCAETNDLKKENEKQRIYLLGNGEHNLMMKVNNCPLDKEFTDVLIDASKNGFTANESITNEEAIALSSHKANLELEYIFGSEEKIDRAIFTSQLIVSIFKHFKGIGLVNVSAQSYIPANKLTHILQKQNLLLTDIIDLFINTQTVKSGNITEVHTHGLEQFYLPDMILYPKNNLDINYNTTILKNACVYNIENNNILKIGDVFQLTGYKETFTIEKTIPDEEHPYGLFGALGIREK